MMRTVGKAVALFGAVLLSVSSLVSCAKAPTGNDSKGYEFMGGEMAVFPENKLGIAFGETAEDHFLYSEIKENGFVVTAREPVSTFSSDVDTASYTFFRRLVNAGYSFSELSDAFGSNLRTEEMVNYFDYDCPVPEGSLFGIKAVAAPCPYNDSVLLMLTMKTEDRRTAEKNNLVFLIDVSGSMASGDKLALLKKSFSYLTERLDENDTVSIVTYSGKEEVILEGCPGSEKQTILDAVNSLRAAGSTNGEAGLNKAYALAEKYFIAEGNNRIFLASDGDLNVGISSPEELKNYVAQKRNSGVYLSVLGFGEGNYRDSNMETLADNGNGVYLYIDGESEAEKVFGEDLLENLYTVANDVKLQLTFHPGKVEAYRLVGYENRVLSNEDFTNDRKDAGELGAGHTLTVFYELKMAQAENAEEFRNLDFATLSVRYKEPGQGESRQENFTLAGEIYTEKPDDEFLFACAVVECSALLRGSAYKGNASLGHLESLLSDIDTGEDFYKNEFRELVKKLSNNSSR